MTLYLYTLCDFWRKNAGGIRKTANQAAESSLAFADSHSLKVFVTASSFSALGIPL